MSGGAQPPAPAETYDPLEPCGWCRRCAIHDDPGGCLEVERWERENPEAAARAIAAAREDGES